MVVSKILAHRVPCDVIIHERSRESNYRKSKGHLGAR